MDYFKSISDAMIDAGATVDAAAAAIERMEARPARDYFTQIGADFPLIVEMVAAGLTVAVAARITLSVIDEYRAVSPIHAIAAMDLNGDEWAFADEIDDEELSDIDLLDGRPGGDMSFLGFRFSLDADDRA